MHHGNEFIIPGTRLCSQPTSRNLVIAPTLPPHIYLRASFQNAWYHSWYLLYGTVPGTTLGCPYIAYKKWRALMLGPIFYNSTSGTRIPGTVLAEYANMTFLGHRDVHQFML